MADYVIATGTSIVDGNGNYSHVQPGDRLLIPAGTRGKLEFHDLVGTLGNEIVVVNHGGQAIISVSGAQGILFSNCQYIRVTGGGTSGVTYGFYILGYTAVGLRMNNGTQYIEADSVRINGQWPVPSSERAIAMACVSKWTEPDVGIGVVIHDVEIHHCLFENVGGETIYAGKADYGDGLLIDGLSIHDCIIDGAMVDGIQAAQADDVEIYNNVVSGVGQAPPDNQSGSGIVLGAQTRNVKIHGNVILDSLGGLYVDHHTGPVEIYENVIARMTTRGIQIATNTFAGDLIRNNTIVDVLDRALKVKAGTTQIEIHSNLLAASGTISSDGNVHDNCTFSTVADVRFADAGADDYTLRADSPARAGGAEGVDCGAYQYDPQPTFPNPEDPIPAPVYGFREPAFPSAVGAGGYAQGGRGTTIYRVTTLANAGAGSFREACEATGARIVVFDVAGYIDLETAISIEHPHISVFGQTAPGHGVAIRSHCVYIRTHDVTIRFVKFNPGYATGELDALVVEYAENGLGDADRWPHEIMIDHCSFRWAQGVNVRLLNSNWNDQLPELNVGINKIRRVTIQWCFVYESFDEQGFVPVAGFSQGIEIGGGCDDITLAYNLVGSCREGIRVRTGAVELINNLLFNCIVSIRVGGERIEAGLDVVDLNCVSNWEIFGNDSQQNHMILIGESALACTDPPGEPDHDLYVHGNNGQFKSWPAGTEWDIVGCAAGIGSDASTIWQTLVANTIEGGRAVPALTLATAYARILRRGGARMPTGYGRDKGDRRIVQAVKAHGGRIPTGGADTPKGWPTLSPGTEGALDTDGDSIPDWFEIANGSDPDLADADEYDYDGGGAYQQPYMNVEVHENVTAGDPHVLVYVQVN